MFSHIDQPRIIRTALALLCILTSSFGSRAFAQENGQPAEGDKAPTPLVLTGLLTPSKTRIDTENTFLGLSTTRVAAFPSMRVTCPVAHTAGCTIKVEVSSQFWNIASGSVAQVFVAVTGGLTVNPSSLVNVDSTTSGGLASVRTFQWMIRGVPAGTTQTVTISFDVSSGTGASGFRTATVQLFLN